MNLAKLLKLEAVKVLSSTTSKKRLLTELGELAHSAHGLNAQSVVEALLAREGLGPTGVGHGVALPHARIDDIDEVTGLFVLLEKPVDFGAVDRQPVDIAFALFAPEMQASSTSSTRTRIAHPARHGRLCQTARQPKSGHPLYNSDGSRRRQSSLIA